MGHTYTGIGDMLFQYHIIGTWSNYLYCHRKTHLKPHPLPFAGFGRWRLLLKSVYTKSIENKFSIMINLLSLVYNAAHPFCLWHCLTRLLNLCGFQKRFILYLQTYQFNTEIMSGSYKYRTFHSIQTPGKHGEDKAKVFNEAHPKVPKLWYLKQTKN